MATAGARTSGRARARRDCISRCGRRRRSAGGASTLTTISATTSIPAASRPTCARNSGLLASQFLAEPVEPEILQRLRQRLPGLSVVAAFPVPGGAHLLPLPRDGLPHRGAAVPRGALASRRRFAIRRQTPPDGR